MWMRFLYALIQERIKRKWLIQAWILILMALFFLCIIWLRSRLHEVSCYRLLLTNVPFRITFKSLRCKHITGREICANECKVEIFFLDSAGRDRSKRQGINQKTVSVVTLFNYWCCTITYRKHSRAHKYNIWNLFDTKLASDVSKLQSIFLLVKFCVVNIHDNFINILSNVLIVNKVYAWVQGNLLIFMINFFIKSIHCPLSKYIIFAHK